MTDLTNLEKTVIDAIRETEEYKNYIAISAVVKKDPALYARLMELREKNFSIQQSNEEDLMDLMDALTNEYEDVINNATVSDYLSFEAEYCRLVQGFMHELTEGLEFD